MKTILPLLAFALAFNLAPAAEQTIATADFKSIYSKYWKTKQADKKLKDEQDKHQKLVGKFFEDQKVLGQQIEGMERALNAPNLNPLDRQRRAEQLDKKKAGIFRKQKKHRDFSPRQGEENSGGRPQRARCHRR